MGHDDAYARAETRIREAMETGATTLDLSAMRGSRDEPLTEIPGSIGQLTQLERLDVQGNALTAFPETCAQLVNLQYLNIASNGLTSLSDSVLALGHLTRLDVRGNQLRSLPRLPATLEYLDIGRNRFSALPTEVYGLERLTSLLLTGNPFLEIPPQLESLTSLESLTADHMNLGALPASLARLGALTMLDVSGNSLPELPDWIAGLSLRGLILGDNLGGNPLREVPEVVRALRKLELLWVAGCGLREVPHWVSELRHLSWLNVSQNEISDLPATMAELDHLTSLDLGRNPLNPGLAAAHDEGLSAVRLYLAVRHAGEIRLREAKLLLVGEGEVGKSCLLGALRGDPWAPDGNSTHGIEIKPVRVARREGEITFNGWDFGGQRVYRPTHQLFFSAPAIYLVVWKPREGAQQGFVKEWIKLIKHRAPDAKIFVVATHGGPGERQPDIDRQDLWETFGSDTIVDFVHVNSEPRIPGFDGRGIRELRDAIAHVAASLPGIDERVSTGWVKARVVLKESGNAYMALSDVYAVCGGLGMNEAETRLFLAVSHRLGHLIHYAHKSDLSDIVILKPDWLATAISLVLDDKSTRDAHGLVNLDRLGALWNSPLRPPEQRYPREVHLPFLRLMERYDLSYVVAGLGPKDASETSLIAQLVPDQRPEAELAAAWPLAPADGDEQRGQVCRIIDERGYPANAEGLLYQLIVRLHRYSLGRERFDRSVHWQRGIVLDDDYNGRALVEHVGNDLRITVRAAYPEAFLSVLTREVKWLVETFWEGLRCQVMVPCIEPCAKSMPGAGLYEVEKLLESKRKGKPEYPCPSCDEWQPIESLLRNAPAARPPALQQLLEQEFDQTRAQLDIMAALLRSYEQNAENRFSQLDQQQWRLMALIHEAAEDLLRSLADEAKDGPRLFSFEPTEPGFFDRPGWMSQRFKLTLWCEHSRTPLPLLSGDPKTGVYELDLPRGWLVKAAPFLKVLSGTLGLVLPVAAAGTKLALDDAAYKGIEEQLELGKSSAESLLKGGEQAGAWMAKDDGLELGRGKSIRAEGSVLRQLHRWLQDKDPGFGGLERVMNKQQAFLWVHPKFAGEY